MLTYRRHIKDVFFKFMKYSKSTKKFIRTQKAQIRRQFWDVKKQEELIKEMYNKINQVK
jgi:hypothetical protein